jgi:UV DNA damage repair endonuclease
VDEAVQHGVRYRRIADDLVPVIDRHLAGDNGGAAVVALVHDLQQITALFTVSGTRPQSSRSAAAP